jgi:hypothetical protein
MVLSSVNHPCLATPMPSAAVPACAFSFAAMASLEIFRQAAGLSPVCLMTRPQMRRALKGAWRQAASHYSAAPGHRGCCAHLGLLSTVAADGVPLPAIGCDLQRYLSPLGSWDLQCAAMRSGNVHALLMVPRRKSYRANLPLTEREHAAAALPLRAHPPSFRSRASPSMAQ